MLAELVHDQHEFAKKRMVNKLRCEVDVSLDMVEREGVKWWVYTASVQGEKLPCKVGSVIGKIDPELLLKGFMENLHSVLVEVAEERLQD